jgi:prephenate dehydrogenase
MIDDKPGELARLFNEVGEVGINVEDLKLEHSPGAQIGLVELSVIPGAGDRLVSELTARGWRFA